MSGAFARKQRERKIVESFLALSRVAGEIVEEREAPDFMVRISAEKVVGIEVTELYVHDDGSGFAPKAKESLSDRVIAAARERYERRGGKPIHVSVGFSPRTDFSTLNRDETANALAEFLLNRDFCVEKPTYWRQTYSDRGLPTDIIFLNVLGLRDQRASHWTVPRAGWIAPLTEAVLRAAIAEKSGKLEQYRLAVSEIWLLLSATGGAPSQGFDRDPDVEWELIDSPFDRTYLLSFADGKVWRVGSSAA